MQNIFEIKKNPGMKENTSTPQFEWPSLDLSSNLLLVAKKDLIYWWDFRRLYVWARIKNWLSILNHSVIFHFIIALSLQSFLCWSSFFSFFILFKFQKHSNQFWSLRRSPVECKLSTYFCKFMRELSSLDDNKFKFNLNSVSCRSQIFKAKK